MSSFILTFASYLGASESSIRLLLSLLSGYPLAWLYRSPLMYNRPLAVKHTFFTLTGLFLCYFNFGYNVFHSLVNIITVYFLLKLTGGTKFSVAFAFVYNTLYLVLGYWFTLEDKNESYIISWTMPHCVLTLRLTAVAFDIYDGQKRPVPKDAQDSALFSCPTLLELLGQSYCFGGFLVGPQYCMRRYLNFVSGEYSNPITKGPPDSLVPAFKRFMLGVIYIGLYQIVYIFISDEYLLSSAFQERGLLFKCAVLIVWGKTCLNKYIGSWLLAEGSIIYMGLSFNGVDNNNVAQWDACTNIKVRQLECGSTLHNYIHCFNCNTNLWMARYLFKRLRFLGSKTLSQSCTLLYLAVWHGVYSGYYVCFFLEFVYTTCERQVEDLMQRKELKTALSSPVLKCLIFLGQKIFSSFLISFALVSFSLLSMEKWFSVSIFLILSLLCDTFALVHKRQKSD